MTKNQKPTSFFLRVDVEAFVFEKSLAEFEEAFTKELLVAIPELKDFARRKYQEINSNDADD
jgi:hypothetical protein